MTKIALYLLFLVTIANSNAVNERIVGGTNATDGKYPYQVSIRNRGKHDCGGSIIDKQWILTAAHCLLGKLESKLTVVVGTNRLDEGGEIYNVTKLIPHPKFSRLLFKDDIGLIKVNRPIEYGPKVQPINLPTSDVDSGKLLTLTGWGQLHLDGDVSNELQEIQLESISYIRCALSHGFLKIWITNLCTLSKAGEGPCFGDSGGPLVYDGRLVGVVSWSKPCATGKPDVNTRVFDYLIWILTNKMD